jgi:hypothetical protein
MQEKKLPLVPLTYKSFDPTLTPQKKPRLDLAVFGGFNAVKALWRALGAGLWVPTPAEIETELRGYTLHSLETATSSAATQMRGFLHSPRPAGCLWVCGIREPYGQDHTPPAQNLRLILSLSLPLVVLHFARPKQQIPDEAEINLRELLSSLGTSGDEVPVLQCPAFEEPQEIITQALSGLGPFLDEHLLVPPHT